MKQLARRWFPLPGLLLLCLAAALGYVPWVTVPMAIGLFCFSAAITLISLSWYYGDWSVWKTTATCAAIAALMLLAVAGTYADLHLPE